MKPAGVLFALCCVLFAPALGQYLESVIVLPDTLGPLTEPYCLAWDDNPAHPRLYVGGQSYTGGVVVAEAITCKRLARIPTGPVAALCFVPTHNKLYVAKASCDTIAVVDCATNQIVSMITLASEAPALQYNRGNDRLYCGGRSISVLDCAADTVMHTIALAATIFALDTIHNKLFAGRSGPLSVVDCVADSVVATIRGVAAGALCFNPSARKVYAVGDDTLYAICADGDSVVARLAFSNLKLALACDPQRNRIYCADSAGWGHWSSIDCSVDTILLTRETGLIPPSFLACNVARDRLYCCFGTLWDAVMVYDATSGEYLKDVMLDGLPVGGGWSSGLDRLFCLPSQSNCLLSAVDGAGDSIAGVIPLRMAAENITLDTVHNRLYFMYTSSASGSIGVVDCSRNVVTSYTYAGERSAAMCYNPNNNRLYWGADGSIAVYDCSTNTVRNKVKTSGYVRAAQLHLGLNKLYTYSDDSLGRPVLDVIDCNRDIVVRVIALADGPRFLHLTPEDNVLWCLGWSHVMAIDCIGDSVVADAEDNLGYVDDACVCREDRKICTPGGQLVDMDNPTHVESLPFWASRLCYVPRAHKLYGCANYSGHPPGNSRVYVVDMRISTITDSFWAGRQIAGMCLDHTGDFVYCAAYEDTLVLVIDARTDSVVATIEVPILAATKDPLVANRRTKHVYEAQYGSYIYGNGIPVIRDSMLVALEELAAARPTKCVGPTMVSRGAPIQVRAASELWDATGRRVAVLGVGLNPVGRLAPGVYFVLDALQASSYKPHATRKVVIAE